MYNAEIPVNFSGTVLIASPFLKDPNFRGSVVFLANETAEGILGFILNRRTEQKLSDFWRPVFGYDCPISAYVYIGGPVAGPLAVLHRSARYADFQSGHNYYLTLEKKRIGELVSNEIEPLKFFLGQSGWTRDQLIEEIDCGAWHLLPPGETDLFRDDTEFWVRELQKSASRTFARVLGVHEFPENPEEN